MDDHVDGTLSGCWEIDDFIIRNDKDGRFLTTKVRYAKNYFRTLRRLYNLNQILIQRGDDGKIIGVCAWARINKEDERDVNKITWQLPYNIKNGNNLYVVFCIISGGNLLDFKRILVKRFRDVVDEVFWFNSPNSRFVRRKNILKERYNVT